MRLKGTSRFRRICRPIKPPRSRAWTQSVCRFTRSGTRMIWRSEEHTSELQSLMRISYAVFCLKKKKISNDSTFNRHNIVSNDDTSTTLNDNTLNRSPNERTQSKH